MWTDVLQWWEPVRFKLVFDGAWWGYQDVVPILHYPIVCVIYGAVIGVGCRLLRIVKPSRDDA